MIYGVDEMLLETRGRLVETIQFRADESRNRGEFGQFITLDAKYAVIVLCQSLSEEQRIEAKELLSELSNKAYLLDLRTSIVPTEFLAEIGRLASV